MPTSENTAWNGGFWTNRYKQAQTGWDLGAPSTPLKSYIDQLSQKDMAILIPGAGNAYEAEYLHRQGFTQVTVMDLSAEPLENLKQRCPEFPEDHLVQGDFFAHQGSYDVILEQTFFCALDPSLREAYVEQMAAILKPQGHLAGVLFDIPLNSDHPPFGGNRDSYRTLFEPHFHFHTWETCYNSIPPRAGNELWINLQPKR